MKIILDEKFDEDLAAQTYLVKWKGYDDTENEWNPHDNFDSETLIDTYYIRWNKLNPHSAKFRAKEPLEHPALMEAVVIPRSQTKKRRQ